MPATTGNETYFQLTKGQTVKIDNNYTLELLDNKSCTYGPWVGYFVLNSKTQQYNFSLTLNRYIEQKPLTIIDHKKEIIIKFTDLNPEFAKIDLYIKPLDRSYNVSTIPNGWYLNRILKGDIDIMSNQKHPVRLTDNDGNPVLVWRDKTRCLHIVYV